MASRGVWDSRGLRRHVALSVDAKLPAAERDAMTDTTNGWSGKPGVPMNPERDGWHWVSLLGGECPQIMEWFSDAMVWADDWTVEACALHLRYHGPCLTPDQAAALQARVAELEVALRELIDLTHDCEKELTEKLYRVDFCAESLPLTNARAALEGKKDE